MNTSHRVKVVKVVRATSTSYYIPVPRELVEKVGISKGHVLDWTFQTRDNLLLKHLGPDQEPEPARTPPCKRRKKR